MLRQTMWIPLLALGLAACGGKPAEVAAPPVQDLDLAADSMLVRAEDHYRHGRWGKLLDEIERLNFTLKPADARRTRMLFLSGEAKLALGDQLQAARDFRKVADDTPAHPLASDALLRAGDAFFEIWRRPELDPTYGTTALATYQEVQSRFPGTPAARRAAMRVQELNDRFAFKKYKAATFYIRMKAYDAAVLYLRDLVATWPRSAIAPEALLRLVATYDRLGYEEDRAEACGYIRRFHAGYPGVETACPLPAGGPS